jgi:hypothetical protein
MARRCPVRISTLTDIPGDNGMSLPSMLMEQRERPIVSGNTKPWTLAVAVAVVEACGFTAARVAQGSGLTLVDGIARDLENK